MKRKNKFYLREWQRTVILVLLLLAGIAFMYWTTHSYDQNFINSF